MNTISPRFRSIGILLTVMGIAIILQIVRMQFSADARTIETEVETYSYYNQKLEPIRGLIYDRHGNLLAGNKTVYEIGVDPQYIPDRLVDKFIWAALTVFPDLDLSAYAEYKDQPDAEILANIIARLKEKQAKAKAEHDRKNLHQNFVLERFATPEQAYQIFQLALDIEKVELNKKYSYMEEDLHIPDQTVYWMQFVHPLGLNFFRHYDRIYPEKSLASNVIGFVSRDAKVDMQGVEGKYDRILAGNSKLVSISRNPNEAGKSPTQPEGASIVLTLDREMQAEIETIADNTLKDTEATSVTIVVMDPKTGEILTMAVSNRIDLNQPDQYGETYDFAYLFNRAVSVAYEPGSVFKVLTMAAGLDAGVVKPDTVFRDTGVFEILDAKYYNWDRAAHGDVTMQQCMEKSLNVCLAWVATQLGNKQFYKYMQNFGIGSYTGVDLAFETPGRLKLPEDDLWTPAELGANSFGQGVDVTTVQMLMAISAVASDGQMRMPHLVKALIENGRQHEVTPQIVGAPISAQTARTLTQMLTESLENGEAQNVLVPGYRVAGKTGTAQIPIPEEFRYDDQLTNASFVGWGPSDDPRFLVYVWVEKPLTDSWGSTIAAPVFRQVVERIVVLMDLPPDAKRQELANTAALVNSQAVTDPAADVPLPQEQ